MLGGSCDHLALAYAETHLGNITQMILFGVTTDRHEEFDWLFRGSLSIFFSEQWERLHNSLPLTERDSDIVEAFSRLPNNPNQEIRQKAAEARCMWESATADWPPTNKIQERFETPTYSIAFARLVTHYVSHNAWIEDGILLRNADSLSNIAGILSKVWHSTKLLMIEDAGHNPDDISTQALVHATDTFASIS